MADLGGRPRAFDSPEEFEKLGLEYIEWVKKNPVMKTITASFQGIISYKKIPHARPMTQYGMAAHMNVGLRTLLDYGAKDEFSHIFKRLCAIMTAHNVDGATSGDMSGNIIARIEGLTDKKEIDAKVALTDDFDALMKESKNES